MISRYRRILLFTLVVVTITLLFWVYPVTRWMTFSENNNHAMIRRSKEKPSGNINNFTRLSSHPIITPTKNRIHLPFGQPNIYPAQNVTKNYRMAHLKTRSGPVPIYVYHVNDLISVRLLQSGTWEPGSIAELEDWLTRIPDLNLIDVGCNLGVYTLVAAKKGRRVIAVDANINNIRRLSKSVFINKLEDKVTIVYNGISDVYTYFSVSSPDPSNIGHSMIIKSDAANKRQTKVKSLYMDDLIKVIDFKKAILKIDIEGHEVEAFRKVDKLFTTIQIVAVMMEWNYLKTNYDENVPLSIKSLFHKHGFVAYASLNSNFPLNPEDYKSWPGNIVWKK